MPTSDLGAEAWESLFWSLFERSTNPVALVDEQRVVIEANRAMCQLLGVPHDDFLAGVETGFDAEWRELGKAARATASAP